MLKENILFGIYVPYRRLHKFHSQFFVLTHSHPEDSFEKYPSSIPLEPFYKTFTPYILRIVCLSRQIKCLREFDFDSKYSASRHDILLAVYTTKKIKTPLHYQHHGHGTIKS